MLEPEERKDEEAVRKIAVDYPRPRRTVDTFYVTAVERVVRTDPKASIDT